MWAPRWLCHGRRPGSGAGEQSVRGSAEAAPCSPWTQHTAQPQHRWWRPSSSLGRGPGSLCHRYTGAMHPLAELLLGQWRSWGAGASSAGCPHTPSRGSWAQPHRARPPPCTRSSTNWCRSHREVETGPAAWAQSCSREPVALPAHRGCRAAPAPGTLARRQAAASPAAAGAQGEGAEAEGRVWGARGLRMHVWAH